MRVAVTTAGCDGGLSGIGRYTSALLQQWQSAEVDLRVFGFDDERKHFLPSSKEDQWSTIPSFWKKPLANVLWTQTALPLASCGADVLFLPAGNRRLPLYSEVPTVGTVHDLSALHVAGKYDPARNFYIKRVLPKLIERLTYVVTVSENSRRDILSNCDLKEERITVIPLAADAEIFRARDADEAHFTLRHRLPFASPFLLYTSRIEHPGKNHVGLIEAFELLKRRYKLPHQLVFVGPEKERADEVRRRAVKSLYATEIHFMGAVPALELPLFYNAADILVFPSFYEGFGLPLLEAMMSHLPLACSRTSSLPEVAGDAAEYFDPSDVESMADAVACLLQESAQRRTRRITLGSEIASRFTWERTAASTLRILTRCMGTHTAWTQPVTDTCLQDGQG